jgi:predicted phosphodiesterase
VRVALISDVHSNATALDAVLGHARSQGAEAVWNMGDLVGYGPDPDAVAATLSAAGARSVLGNHDAAAIGELDLTRFNPLAAAAAKWTAANISAATIAYLRALPLVSQDEQATLAHGTLRDPLWEYLETYDEARAQFELQETAISIVGHTHHPVLLHRDRAGRISSVLAPQGEPYELDRPGEWCINPGSVGQPRDGDPRASYALLDLPARTVTYWRITYDVGATQQRMRERGLAEPHIARLALGR